MKVLVAFDSYKGSLSSWEAGNIAARAIQSVMPDAECEVIPMADGGEGTVDAIVKATSSSYETIRVTGPMGKACDTQVGLIPDKAHGHIAVLEVASICGLTMVGEDGPDPLKASSYGVGEAILQLLDKGIRRFTIGLGGSATNDGGMGMLAALGADFRDEQGMRLHGVGNDLLKLASVTLDQMDARLAQCDFVVATDVSNPLCGPQGATMVYGPQKGVISAIAPQLDEAMHRYSMLLEQCKISVINSGSLRDKAGAGAAGGLGFALMALGAEAVSGGDWLFEMTGLKGRIAQADWVITGEGLSDHQTLYGKLPIKVAHAAKETGTGCLLISGSLGEGIEELQPYFQGCFSIVQEPVVLDTCMEQAAQLLERTVREVFRLIAFVEDRE